MSRSAKSSAGKATAKPKADGPRSERAANVPAAQSVASSSTEPVLSIPDRLAPPPAPRRPVEHDLLLAALPHPVIVLGDENRIVYANAAAESFISAGLSMLKRMRLDDVVVFGCPLLALVDQVQSNGRVVQRVRR